MTNNNRITGTTFERRLCLTLSGYGFWAHNLAQNSAGQPFDVMASRNGQSHPIDCKVCANDLFKLERVEENQYSAMTLWRDTGNGEGWFAMELSNGAIYFLSFSEIETKLLLTTVLSRHDIMQGIPLREWVELCK